MADTTDLLDFVTTQKRRIKIDGASYPLRRMLDLPIDKHLYVEREMPEVGRLSLAVGAGTATKKDVAALSEKLRQIVVIAVEAPAKVLDRLSDVQRLELCRVFLELPNPSERGRPEAKRRRVGRSTGTTSSRA